MGPRPPLLDSGHREQLNNILESHHAAGEFVGARIALRDPDGTITEASAGTTTVDPASGPVDPDVPWNIGSATKTFVAVVVLQLADEGRIDLDAGIDRYVPDLPGADRITPRQLLQHTSGLGEYLDQPAVRTDPQREWTPAELIAVAEAAGRFGEPGGPHHYSNTNYIVLGEIIEQVTGNPWADEVQTRIAEPLGMTHTSLTDEPLPPAPLVDGSFVDATRADPSIGGAAGALQSTSRDLLDLRHGAFGVRRLPAQDLHLQFHRRMRQWAASSAIRESRAESESRARRLTARHQLSRAGGNEAHEISARRRRRSGTCRRCVRGGARPPRGGPRAPAACCG